MATDPRTKFSQMSKDDLRPILQQVLDTDADPLDGWTVTEIGGYNGRIPVSTVYYREGTAEKDAAEGAAAGCHAGGCVGGVSRDDTSRPESAPSPKSGRPTPVFRGRLRSD